MMTEETFAEWLASSSHTEEAKQIIRRIRQSDPSRAVQGGRSNVTGRYPSRKMGGTIQFESHKVELPFIRDYEYSEEVLEYYDQPEPIKLTFTGKNSKRVTTLSTADFFVLCRDGTAGWEECKTEEELLRLVEKSDRFRRNGDGSWSSPAGEAYAERFGLFYRVRVSGEINWTYQRNLSFLEDYLHTEGPSPDPSAAALVRAIVISHQGILLSDILRHTDCFTPDDVYLLLARGELYVDIHAHVLADPQRTPVFTDRVKAEAHIPAPPGHRQPNRERLEIILEPGECVTWDRKPYTIVNTGEGHIWLQDDREKLLKVSLPDFHSLVNTGDIQGIKTAGKDSDAVYDLLRHKSPKDLAAAHERLKALQPFLTGSGNRPSSSEYFWLKRYKNAEAAYGSGFLGLFDEKASRGNRMPKLPLEVIKQMEECIENIYLDTCQPKVKSVYGTFRNRCEALGLSPASYKTFLLKAKRVDEKEKTLKRKGRRAAYQVEITYWELTATTPRHGDRPFEIVHIDHTQLDIQIVDSKTSKVLGRPWLTLMVDAFSRRVLAYYLTFEPPSYRSCMMVLRECVKRFNRLPQTIVVDNGKEFKSKYFEVFLASYHITRKDRPPAEARFGAVLERLFGTTNTQLIYNLQGNTQIMKDVRLATKSVNPERLAIWTLPSFSQHLEKFLCEIYDTIDHPALGQSPRDCFLSIMALFGNRQSRIIPYDQAFIMNSLPTTPKGHAKVIQSRGIKINNFFYRCEAFRSPLVINSMVPVRYDPFDIGVAYAFVGREWRKCTSEYFPQLSGLTEYELKSISEEIRKRRGNHNKGFNITAQKIASFIEEARECEVTLRVQRRASETLTANGELRVKSGIDSKEPLEEAAAVFRTADITETYTDL